MSDTISKYTDAISEDILNPNSNTIPKSDLDHSHRSTVLQEGGHRQWLCEAVGKHLSSWYVAQVDISITSHIWGKIVLGRNVCNCSSFVASVLGTQDQWLWIGEHVRDSQNAELVHKMRDLCESHATYSKGIVFGIGCGLGSQQHFSPSAVDHSSEGDNKSTCRCVVIWASSIVRIDGNPQPVWIGRVVSMLSSGSICRFI